MRIQGDLATYEFSDLLQWLAQGCKTGILTVSDGDVEYQLGFDRGRIDMSSSSDPEKRLDNYLFGKGVIDEATLARAERLREATQMMSGQVLVTLGAVSEIQLAQALRDKTEAILCELLTWDRGTFEFAGGERAESNMVPISLEVTKLLLESMHRLDQGQQGEHTDAIIGAAVESGAPGGPHVSPDATQAIEGLALAEVLDPESPPPAAPPASPDPVEEVPGVDLPPPYAVMAQSPGWLRRLAPFALVVILSFLAGGFYLANIEASAEAVDVGPGGEPILFTQTSRPPRLAEANRVVAAPAAAPTPAADRGEAEEALRRHYERELASLRQELEEARRLAPPAAAGRRARPARDAAVAVDLPADSVMRAAVTPSVSAPSSTAEPPVPSPPPPPESPAAVVSGAAAGPPTVAPEPPTPAAPAEPAVVDAPGDSATDLAPAVESVNPSLVARPAPQYPTAARRHGRGAVVRLRVLIGADGRVEEAERMGAKAGMGFDRAAEEAALESTWEPGTRNGEPVAMWAVLRFEFKPKP